MTIRQAKNIAKITGNEKELFSRRKCSCIWQPGNISIGNLATTDFTGNLCNTKLKAI